MTRRHAVDGGAQRQHDRDLDLAAQLLAGQLREGNPTAAHLASLLLGLDYLTDEQEAAA